ncbi:MAG: permease [Sphaerochaeta sp.]|jgi:predicted permease|nr:permease [Sphaerochaeta sp.]MDX9915030.1 permease [Sphaerochaeta sp.]
MATNTFASLPILFLFLLGYGMRRTSFLSEKTIVELKNLILNVGLPALLFESFLTLDVRAKDTVVVLLVYLLCVLMLALGHLLARLLRIKSPYFPLMMTGFEVGMFGLAVFSATYGAVGLSAIAFIGLGQTFFVFTIQSSALTAMKSGRRPSVASIIGEFVKSPVTVGMVGGIVAGMVRVPASLSPYLEPAGAFIHLLGSMTVPLITIAIGWGVQIEGKTVGLSLFTIAIRKVILVTLALLFNHWILDRWLGMAPIFRQAMLIMALTPPPFVISAFMKSDSEGENAYVHTTLSVDTVVSIVLVMAAVALYR